MHLLFSANYFIAAVFFLILALTDAIDGILARSLGQTTDLGKFLDPIADKILVISALIGLIEIRHIPSIPVIIIITRDFVVSAIRLEAAKKGKVVAASYLGKIKTVSQVIAALFLILDWPFAMLILWVSVLLTLISGVDYIAGKQ